MARFLHQEFIPHHPARRYVVLLGFWIAGSMCGIVSACHADVSFLSMMHRTVYCSASIVRLLVTVFLPFLLSAMAVFLSVPRLLFPIAFVRAYLLTFVSMGILLTFGSAGWLFRFLIGFGDIASVPLLFFFWLRCLREGERICHTDFLVVASLIFMIVCIDFRIISPLLAGFISL